MPAAKRDNDKIDAIVALNHPAHDFNLRAGGRQQLEPLEGPPLAECRANGTNPTTRVTHWTSGRCENNFCELVPLLTGPGGEVAPSDTIWVYTIVEEVIGGKRIPVCELTASQAAKFPDINVKDCKPGSAYLH